MENYNKVFAHPASTPKGDAPKR